MKAHAGRGEDLRGKSSKKPKHKKRLGTKLKKEESHEELEDGPSRKLKEEEEDKRLKAELDRLMKVWAEMQEVWSWLRTRQGAAARGLTLRFAQALLP